MTWEGFLLVASVLGIVYGFIMQAHTNNKARARRIIEMQNQVDSELMRAIRQNQHFKAMWAQAQAERTPRRSYVVAQIDQIGKDWDWQDK